ncbi:MAG: response regulator transcription factor [Elusimicrobiota bacterium]|jgi:two-component system phosphate regulon response regulator PhoB/two-component system alkaline phosphatase synthesis response regulator PhoP|nr:response regulator transcription factor [Elusimicrobiota bacterium]
MSKLIAAVDDEEDILEALSLKLEKEHYKFKGFTDAEKLFSFLTKNSPDLFILDIMLPDVDGFDICKELRKNANFARTPIIFLSAKSDELDKVLGLELGADDYITKPFSPKELSARVKAVFRRCSNDKETLPTQVPNNEIKIDKEAREVFSDGKKINLTLIEFKILELLIGKKNKVFTRDEILDSVWGKDKAIIDRTVDVHIKNIRDKIGNNGKRIKNIRSIGYKFED